MGTVQSSVHLPHEQWKRITGGSMIPHPPSCGWFKAGRGIFHKEKEVMNTFAFGGNYSKIEDGINCTKEVSLENPHRA